MKQILSGAFGKPREDLICFDVQEILGKDQVEVARHDADVTENDNEEFEEVTDENMSASFKESVSKDTSGAKEEPYDY